MDADSPAVEAVREARDRALAAGSARVELAFEITLKGPEPLPAAVGHRRGGLLRPLVRPARRALKRFLKLLSRLGSRRNEAEGVLDLTGRRYMLDYGSYAVLHADGQEWAGRSGRPLATLSASPAFADSTSSPLWLLDLLAGMVAAEDDGTEHVRGRACRRVAVTTDLSRASRVTPGGLGVPVVNRFEELLALTVSVWLDAGELRRMRFADDFLSTTLELWDYGAALDDLDWSRLPTFRTTLG